VLPRNCDARLLESTAKRLRDLVRKHVVPRKLPQFRDFDLLLCRAYRLLHVDMQYTITGLIKFAFGDVKNNYEGLLTVAKLKVDSFLRCLFSSSIKSVYLLRCLKCL